ncbi:MAG: hypothetical protein U1E36_09165 [Rickettsiales bacterium]
MTTVDVKDLVVVEMDSKHLTPKILDWKRTHPVFPIEACGTQVWLMTKDQLEACPISRNASDIEWRYENKAYAYFLQLTAGLDSAAEGECNIVKQVRDSWEQFSQQWLVESKDLQHIYQSVLSDSSLVRKAITQDVVPARYETSARNLANMRGQERILVIADAQAIGTIGNKTTSVLKSIGGTRSRDASKRPSMIVVTHPRQSTMDRYKEVVDKLEDEGALKVPIVFKPFELCMREEVSIADRIFLCYPSGKDKPTTERVISEFEKNRKPDAILVHSQVSVASNDFGGDSEHYVTDQAIRNKLDSQHKHNRMRKQQGLDACENCAYSRASGKRPIERFVHLMPYQYQQRTSAVHAGISR